MHRCIQGPKTLDIHHSICLVDGSDVETQWSTCTNGAQTSPVAGAEPREVMPLVSYRASVEAVLHEIHEVAGRRQSAKQVLNAFLHRAAFMYHQREREAKGSTLFGITMQVRYCRFKIIAFAATRRGVSR